MKNVFLALAISFFAAQTFAAEVLKVKVDETGKNLLIDVMYGGGCLEHTFEVQMRQGCARSMPAQCHGTLVDTTNGFDACEALVGKTVTVSIESLGVSMYNRPLVTIMGDRDSAVTVQLP